MASSKRRRFVSFGRARTPGGILPLTFEIVGDTIRIDGASITGSLDVAEMVKLRNWLSERIAAAVAEKPPADRLPNPQSTPADDVGHDHECG